MDLIEGPFVEGNGQGKKENEHMAGKKKKWIGQCTQREKVKLAFV